MENKEDVLERIREFTNEELEKQLKLTKACIWGKWIPITKGSKIDKGGDNCPLCSENSGCSDCILVCCEETPYMAWVDHLNNKHWVSNLRCVHCPECVPYAKAMTRYLAWVYGQGMRELLRRKKTPVFRFRATLVLPSGEEQILWLKGNRLVIDEMTPAGDVIELLDTDPDLDSREEE